MRSRLAVKNAEKGCCFNVVENVFFTLNKVLLLLCPLIVKFELEFIINNILIVS